MTILYGLLELDVFDYRNVTDEQVNAWVDAYKTSRDQKAAHMLYLTFERLIKRLAFRYGGVGTDLSGDLQQEGHMALLSACDNYQSDLSKFSSVVYQRASKAMTRWLFKHRSIVHMPDSAEFRKAFFYLFKAQKSGNVPSHSACLSLAREMKISNENFIIARTRLLSSDFSANTQVGDDDAAASFQDFIADDENPESILDGFLDQMEAENKVSSLMSRLTEKESIIVKKRLLIDEKSDAVTLHEVGTELGISAERVRQLEAQALKKMRQIAA